jgi:hypothetical protein
VSGIYTGAVLDAIEVSAPAVGGGISGGTAAAIAGGAAAGIGGGIVATSGGTSATGQPVPSGSAASTTGPTTSAGPGGNATPPPQPPKPGFFGNAVKTALVGGAVNEGINVIAGGRRGGVTIPPPPGAAMVDPEGAQAAAMLRARQAVAGGLGSTVTGAGTNQGGFTSATSGGKGLLGQ